MKQQNKKHIISRYVLVIGFILVFVGWIIYAMVKNTIIDVDAWNNKANEILAQEIEVVPERGNIYASNGTLLAGNLYYYTARLDWGVKCVSKPDSLMKYLPELCDSLEAMFPHKKADKWAAEFKNEMHRPKRKRSYRIASKLTYGEYMRLKTFPFFNKRRNRNFLYSESNVNRIKPYGMMASRSIGGVSEINDGVHGSSGLEMALDSLLYGVPGKATKIQLTNRLVSYETVPARRGYDIKTTIDVELQDIVEEELNKMCIETEAIWGTAILMEVATGEIKAISNLEHNPKTGNYIEGTNHAVLGYEPGSVMKPISMLVALEDGIVCNIDSVIVTGHSYAYAGGRPITDGHGAASMPVREVIERSSNVGMAKIILRKYERRPGEFYSRLKGLGFFEPMHTGIGGERVPEIDSLGNKNWDRIALSRMAYGYTTKIPPMSTLAIYNAIANDGKYVRPHLVKELMVDGVTDSVIPVSYIRDQVCSPENAAKLRKMLNTVVWGDHGTARVLRDDKVNISGKTGTCFVVENGQYNPAHKRLAFCGFFPYEKPKYTCMVLMNRANRGAARSSGMVLKNIALKLYSRGMLDNVSDYKVNDTKTANAKQHPKRGVMYASIDNAERTQQKLEMNIANTSRFKTPDKQAAGKVPSVLGLGLRDAVEVLEKAGFKIKFKGKGYVAGQSLSPGHDYQLGDVIELSLKI